MAGQLVKDWMTTDVMVVQSDTRLPQAKRLMCDHSIRHLPVVDDDKLVGILTWGDVREASASDSTTLSIYELNTLLDELPVGRIMTRNPITVCPLTTITRAAHLMFQHKIGGLPVIDHDDRLIGIITESDIFKIVALGDAA